jgi:hypothetical protein
MSDDDRPSAPDNLPLAGGRDAGEEDESWPIGFMTVLTLVALYLGWRLVQGIGWVIDKL